MVKPIPASSYIVRQYLSGKLPIGIFLLREGIILLTFYWQVLKNIPEISLLYYVSATAQKVLLLLLEYFTLRVSNAGSLRQLRFSFTPHSFRECLNRILKYLHDIIKFYRINVDKIGFVPYTSRIQWFLSSMICQWTEVERNIVIYENIYNENVWVASIVLVLMIYLYPQIIVIVKPIQIILQDQV